jgi:hypothetical protein
VLVAEQQCEAQPDFQEQVANTFPSYKVGNFSRKEFTEVLVQRITGVGDERDIELALAGAVLTDAMSVLMDVAPSRHRLMRKWLAINTACLRQMPASLLWELFRDE